MLVELCQAVLDGLGMPVEYALCLALPIFIGNGDIMNCSCYTAVRIFWHKVKVVECVLEERLCKMVSVNMILLCFVGCIWKN